MASGLNGSFVEKNEGRGGLLRVTSFRSIRKEEKEGWKKKGRGIMAAGAFTGKKIELEAESDTKYRRFEKLLPSVE